MTDVTEVFGNSATISTTEYSLPANTTTGVPTSQTNSGLYQLFLDLSALAAGDEFELKVYEKILTGGTQRLLYSQQFIGAQGFPHSPSPALMLKWGWEMTMKKIAGTDRTIAWSIREPA